LEQNDNNTSIKSIEFKHSVETVRCVSFSSMQCLLRLTL
jgi:hypothetical protein